MIVVGISRLQRSHRSLAFLPRALPWTFAFRALGAQNLSFQTLDTAGGSLWMFSCDSWSRIHREHLT